MADYSKYDSRLEMLVMETRTLWETDLSPLTLEERKKLAAALHATPALATKIHYERSHTGFTRIITVTEADVARMRG